MSGDGKQLVARYLWHPPEGTLAVRQPWHPGCQTALWQLPGAADLVPGDTSPGGLAGH